MFHEFDQDVCMEFRHTMLKKIWYNMSFQMRNLLASWVYVVLSLIYGCSFPQSSWFVHLTTLYIKYAFDLHFRRGPQVHLKGFCNFFCKFPVFLLWWEKSRFDHSLSSCPSKKKKTTQKTPTFRLARRHWTLYTVIVKV